MQKGGGLLNLILRLGPGVREKIALFSEDESFRPGEVEFVVLFGQNLKEVRSSVESLGGTFEDLGFGYGIVYFKVEEIDKISQVKGVNYVELPKVLYTSYALSNRASCVSEMWNDYGLSGQGVLVGFIDSGIDYTHPAFDDENGRTRIEYIYDLSQGGMVWNKEQIQKAIDSPDPKSIVNEDDPNGHGTHVAAIACGGGNISSVYYGAAYKSSIAMVKTTARGTLNFGTSTVIMRGIKFLVDKSKELNMPLVINLSFSTNDGAHNGKSIFEQYINTIATLEPISFVAAAGNEGNMSHHVGGMLAAVTTISLNVAGDEPGLIIQFYKGILSNISIEIINPSGISTGSIKVEEGFIERTIGIDKAILFYTGPKPFDIQGEIILSFISVQKQFLQSGIWTIKVTLNNNEPSTYNMWLPVAESLNTETKFLKPDIYNTLGIPATVESVISVGSYNLFNGNISPFSGRGALNNSIIKPDVVSPGENIESAIPKGRYDTKTGTSMAAPEVSGICALLMEWGIVRKNDISLYGQRLKYYLIKGAKRNRTDVTYPDPAWGYGEVCGSGALKVLLGIEDE